MQTKNKGGRPPGSPNKIKADAVSQSISLPRAVLDDLRYLAEHTGESLSAIATEAIRTHLRIRKGGV